MKPKFLGDAEPDVSTRDRRAVLADWITSPENPYFAVNVANRVWAHFMGAGIIEPVDDVRVSNPASNPDLHAKLGAKLIEYKYDLRQLVRDICNSHAYQRSSEPNDTNAADSRNFAKAQVRRIPAEVLLDCLCAVTGAQEKYPGLPMGARAVQIADGGLSTYFLTTFGRAPRTTVCACEPKTEPTLSQALHLLNGSAVHDKINEGKLVETMLEAGKKPSEVVDEIYVRSLGRKPTPEESQRIAELYAGAGTFTFDLAGIGKVHAVEGSKPSLAALEQAARRAQLGHRVTTEARDLDHAPLTFQELKNFDAVVFDPPRAGAKAQSEMLARTRVKRVVAVSCNPATFARDARTLVDGGYDLAAIAVVDQFIWSAHVELVAEFRKR